MSNIIELRVPHARTPLSNRTEALARIFATERRSTEDVFWLKENAEFLNICECTQTELTDTALSAWSTFYEDFVKRLSFFPQYYRFYLSIALDLEDLGMPGASAEEACAWVARRNLADAELSDLQRAEARRLLMRRGQSATAADPGLDDRLRAFVGRDATFVLPNKKAAYELTHIVFYLSEYGRRDPMLPESALRSLEYAGLVALLEHNMDLLAEICIALRYAGHPPSPVWEDHVITGLVEFSANPSDQEGLSDDYHEYLVSCWSARLAGTAAFSAPLKSAPTRFDRAPAPSCPLRTLSSVLLELGQARSGDWHNMRHMLYDAVDVPGRAILDAAEQSTPIFAEFFEGFARASA